MVANIKSKQRFTGSDAFMVLALAVTVLSITASILTEVLRDDSPELARTGAEALAHQMASTSLGLAEELPLQEKNSEGGGRGPASIQAPSNTSSNLNLYEGSLGHDPWGQPYRYKLFRSQDGKAERIIVWSTGPDKVPDTVFDEAKLATQPGKKLSFGGDDVGFDYLRR